MSHIVEDQAVYRSPGHQARASIACISAKTFEALSQLNDGWTVDKLVNMARDLEYYRIEIIQGLDPEVWNLMNEVLDTEIVDAGDLMLLAAFTRRTIPGPFDQAKQDLLSGLITKYHKDCDEGCVKRLSKLLNIQQE
ncbi:hypothetical protein KIPB_011930 [Kipferlia bialata]|uniref:Uncharacterized protein n=1 Tax=Kipferlia bialata TaxID=797122 RepID=A0A9K3GNJ7_9EUKA|nr:hypothetical protein KIPB_011930 [Kipferlia bialata]|eukprot:g11930.t1